MRQLRPYFAGIGADSFSDALWFVALGWLAQTAGDPFTASLIVFAGSVPSAVVMLGLATVAERFATPRTVLVTLLARIAVLALVALLVPIGGTVAVIGTAALLLGLLDGFHITSLETWPLVLSPSETAQTPILAIERIVQRLAQAAAGVVGGWVLGKGSNGGAVGIVLVALAASAVAWVVLMLGRPAHWPAMEDVADSGDEPGTTGRALLLVRQHPVLSRSMVVHGFYNALTFGVALVGFAAVVRSRGWGSSTFGTMYAGWAAGLLAGASLLLRWVGGTDRKVRLALVLIVAIGLLVAVLGSVNSRPLAIGCAAAIGLLGGPVGPALGGYLRLVAGQSSNPGGLTAVQALSTVGVEPIGLLIVGGVLVVAGVSGGLVALGAMICLAAAWALMAAAVRSARS